MHTNVISCEMMNDERKEWLPLCNGCIIVGVDTKHRETKLGGVHILTWNNTQAVFEHSIKETEIGVTTNKDVGINGYTISSFWRCSFEKWATIGPEFCCKKKKKMMIITKFNASVL